MFFGHNISRSINPNLLSDGIAAGTGDTQTSSAVNLNLDQAVMLSIILGTVASGGAGLIKVQGSNDNGVADPFVDLMNTGVPYTSANSGQGIIIDLYRPQKRYLQVVIERTGGGNATVQSIVAYVYHLFLAPESPGTNFGSVGWLSNVGPGTA